MYTQCPNCNVIFSMTEEDLDAYQGLVRCGRCSEVFNASWNLVDNVPNQEPAGLETVTLKATEETIAATDVIDEFTLDDVNTNDDSGISSELPDASEFGETLHSEQPPESSDISVDRDFAPSTREHLDTEHDASEATEDVLVARDVAEDVNPEDDPQDNSLGAELGTRNESPDSVDMQEVQSGMESTSEPEGDTAEPDTLDTADVEAESAAWQALEESLTAESKSEEIDVEKTDVDIGDEIDISKDLPASGETEQVHMESDKTPMDDTEATIDLGEVETEDLEAQPPPPEALEDSLNVEGESENVDPEKNNLDGDLDSKDESSETVELGRGLDAETEPEGDRVSASDVDVSETESIEVESAALEAVQEPQTTEEMMEKTSLEDRDLEDDLHRKVAPLDTDEQERGLDVETEPESEDSAVDLDVLETEDLEAEPSTLQALEDSLSAESKSDDVNLEKSNFDIGDKIEDSDESLAAEGVQQVSQDIKTQVEGDEGAAVELDVLQTEGLEAESAALQDSEDPQTTQSTSEEVNLAKGDIDIADEIVVSNESPTDPSEKITDDLTSETSELLSAQSEDDIALSELDSALKKQADEIEKEHDLSVETHDEVIVDPAEPQLEKLAEENEPTTLEERELLTQEDEDRVSTDRDRPESSIEPRDDSNEGEVDSTQQPTVPQFPLPDVEAEEIIIEAPTKLWKMDEEIGDDAEDKRLPGWSAPEPRSVPASKEAADVKRVRIPYPRPLITATWVVGSIGLLLGLVWQIKGHYLTDLAQVPSLRAPLQYMCQYLSCTVPPRTDIKSIDLVSTSVDPHPITPGALRVSANLINRAEFEQQFPPLEITLTDKEGKVVGRRTYLPHEYRTDAPNRMLPNVLERADFDLAQPDETAVGYEIQLVAR